MSLGASIVKSFLHRTNYYRRRLSKDRFPGPLVLGYHAILPDDADRRAIPFEPLHLSAGRFERHCEVVAENCQPLTLAEFLEGMRDPRQWPDRAVLLTFDDGCRGVATIAAPILRRFELPAVLFACTALLPTGGLLWYDRVAAHLGDGEVERLKEVPDDVRRAVVAGIPEDGPSCDELRCMSLEQLKAIAATPGWSVGGHSHSHPILARCSADVQRDEIVENITLLESCLGTRPTAFSYPNGRPGRDYNETTKRFLVDAGIEIAFTTQSGFVVEASRTLDVPRMVMLNSVSESELLHRMAFSWR